MLLRIASVAAVMALCAPSGATAQVTAQDSIKKTIPTTPHSPSKWYEKISLKGYFQMRYNRLLETNPDLRCELCDKGIGKNQAFEFRRARLIFSGNVHERVYIYLQFDYSADATETNKHFLQIRDAYADIALDKKKKEFRLRLGQSKVPFGFDNLQSSSYRLAFDRSDPINSAAPNERDMGAYFMYAPANIRERFKTLTEEGLKGSGDYGVFTVGSYNGQSANKPELNDNLHAVARLSYPFKIGRQIIEPGLQAYSGLYTIATDKVTEGVKVASDRTYRDERAAASLVLFPQPFGIQAEYNIGRGPEYDLATDSIRVQKLKGGYVTASYRTKIAGNQWLMPFVRYQVYDGGKKIEQDARSYDMNETELGLEWLPFKNLELTLSYVFSKRRYIDHKADNDREGRLLRVQVQMNY